MHDTTLPFTFDLPETAPFAFSLTALRIIPHALTNRLPVGIFIVVMTLKRVGWRSATTAPPGLEVR